MNKIEAFAIERSPKALALLRIVVGFLFIQHGSTKLFHVPYVPDYADVEAWTSNWLAAFPELIGGALIILGLFTRTVALILSGEMAIGYFMIHAPEAFLPILNNGEEAVLFCFVFFYIAAAGPGAWSLDGWRRSDQLQR